MELAALPDFFLAGAIADSDSSARRASDSLFVCGCGCFGDISLLGGLEAWNILWIGAQGRTQEDNSVSDGCEHLRSAEAAKLLPRRSPLPLTARLSESSDFLLDNCLGLACPESHCAGRHLGRIHVWRQTP